MGFLNQSYQWSKLQFLTLDPSLETGNHNINSIQSTKVSINLLKSNILYILGSFIGRKWIVLREIK